MYTFEGELPQISSMLVWKLPGYEMVSTVHVYVRGSLGGGSVGVSLHPGCRHENAMNSNTKEITYLFMEITPSLSQGELLVVLSEREDATE
jgi:hypothetical protein